MAKKPKNYKPQQRRPRQDIRETAAPSVDNDQFTETRENINDVIDRLSSLFEFDAVIKGEMSSSFLGSMTSAMIGSAVLLKNVGIDLELDMLRKDDLEAYLPELVIAVREAVAQLKDEGFDVSESHNIIPRLKFQQLFKKLTEHHMELFDIPPDVLNDGSFEDLTEKMFEGMSKIDPEELSELNGIQYTAYSRLLRIYGLSKRMAKQVKEIDSYDVDIYDNYRDKALKGLERELELNPNTVRRETTKTLRYILSDEVTAMLDYFGYTDSTYTLDTKDGEQDEVPSEQYEYLPQELDFTVLPAGTDLHELATEIVERLSDREKARVDLDRVNVLAAIRDHIGKDRCYYAHGKKTGKQMLDAETETLIDEDYIVLVIQNLSDTGITQSEDALAISPIANKHAAYLTRSDASAGTWREILSLPKQDARFYGARDLRFTGSSGRTPYSMMEEKIKALLACHPDDFDAKLRMRSDGTYRMDNRTREIGKSASKHLIDIVV